MTWGETQGGEERAEESCIHSQGGLGLQELRAAGRTRPCFQTSGLQDRERTNLCCRKSLSCDPLSRQRSQRLLSHRASQAPTGGGEQSQLMPEAGAASPEGSREAPERGPAWLLSALTTLPGPGATLWAPLNGGGGRVSGAHRQGVHGWQGRGPAQRVSWSESQAEAQREIVSPSLSRHPPGETGALGVCLPPVQPIRFHTLVMLQPRK